MLLWWPEVSKIAFGAYWFGTRYDDAAVAGIWVSFVVRAAGLMWEDVKGEPSCCVCCTYRTATRATLLLFPLFGLTGILFSIEPKGSVSAVLAYRIVNALVQTSQVSTITDLIYELFRGAAHKPHLHRQWRAQREFAGFRQTPSRLLYMKLPSTPWVKKNKTPNS